VVTVIPSAFLVRGMVFVGSGYLGFQNRVPGNGRRSRGSG